jgi:group I intron endonuclease
MKFFYEDNSLKSGIYKILNTHTNRFYIGQAKEFKERWKAHKCSLLSGKHQNKFLLSDFNKCKTELGHDDFIEFHVLEVMENSTKEERNKKETEFILEVFDNQVFCYNMSKTAFGKSSNNSRCLSEIHRQAISLAMKGKVAGTWLGKTLSIEHKQKISKANKGVNNAFYGKTHSKESKTKISTANKNRIYQTRSKPVQITHKTTNETKKFQSITEVKTFLNASSFETIARVLRKERSHYKGWIIEYALEHATSVVGLMLTCNAVVLNEKDKSDS